MSPYEPKPEAPSWLQLERRLLGELSEAEAAEVDAIGASAIEALRADLWELPPLDLERPDSGQPLPDDPAPVVPLRLAGWGALLALAAMALLWVALPQPQAPPPGQVQWKGGELALDLDRSRGGEITEHATRFLPGDRLRARLTCPPGERPWRLLVFQGGEVSEPLDDSAPLACANRAVLPGAFTLDSAAPAWVCAVVDAVDEVALREGPAGLPEGSVCVGLEAE
ncbi:MAG: hypothetical protein H6740_19530 [Alphaproteobacteria bacterium]|nr:hypothetical protein [Alphaproteobacteria bacterium]